VPELVSLLPIILIALLFWFLIIRPASKRQKDLARMQAALGAGERVMLTSGVYGVITELREDRVLLEVADGVVIEVARGAIANTVPTADESPASDSSNENRETP